MVGTVPLDSLDDPDVPEVRKLARDRLRRSLKKVIANEKASKATMLWIHNPGMKFVELRCCFASSSGTSEEANECDMHVIDRR